MLFIVTTWHYLSRPRGLKSKEELNVRRKLRQEITCAPISKRAYDALELRPEEA